MMEMPVPPESDVDNEVQEWNIEDVVVEFRDLKYLYETAVMTGKQKWIITHAAAYRFWYVYEDIVENRPEKYSGLFDAASDGFGPFVGAVMGRRDEKVEKRFRIIKNEMVALAELEDEKRRLPFAGNMELEVSNWLATKEITSFPKWREWVGLPRRESKNKSNAEAQVIAAQQSFGTMEQFLEMINKVNSLGSSGEERLAKLNEAFP
jgi:hypothetical protein